MATLQLRGGLLDKLKEIHGIKSDAALANTIGVSHRTVTRVKANPATVQADMIAGICWAFGYSPSDVVETVERPQTAQIESDAA